MAYLTPTNTPPSRGPCKGSSAWVRQNLRKPHIAERLNLSKPHIPPCQQKVSTRGWCGRQSRPHQSCLVLCDESAKKRNDGSSPEFSEQYAHAREAGIHTGIHEFDGRNTPHPKISARVHHRVGYQAGYH